MEYEGVITGKDHNLDFLEYRQGSGPTVEIFDIQAGSARGEGIGRGMVEELFEELEGTGIKLVFAITRETNLIAREFYEAIGFRLLVLIPYFYESESLVASRLGEVNAIMYGRNLN